MENEKQQHGFCIQKYGKFWNIILGHFIKHKAVISEDWFTKKVGEIVQ